MVASLGLAFAATQLLAPQRPSRLPAGAAASDRAPSQAASPAASGASPGSSLSSSPLPDFKVIGGPQPTGHVLLNGDGPRLVDLATGSIKAPFGTDWSNQLFERSGGGYVCVCVDTSGASIERDSWMGPYRALFGQNIPIDYVHADDVGESGISGYKLLYVPYPIMMGERTAQAVARFVEQGGYVVAEARAGWNDARGYATPTIPGFGLDQVFGARETVVTPVQRTALVVKSKNAAIPQ